MNRKQRRANGDRGPLDEHLTQYLGRRMPGGCDDCTAYQTVRRSRGIWHLNVHHDDTCPTYRAMGSPRLSDYA